MGAHAVEAKEFSIEWKLRYLESADFLDLLYRDDEPHDEFAYHVADACRMYREYVTDIRQRGAAFRLPTEGPAAAISRLGLMALAYNCDCCTSLMTGRLDFWDGDDSRLNGDAESQVRPAPKHLPSTARPAASIATHPHRRRSATASPRPTRCASRRRATHTCTRTIRT